MNVDVMLSDEAYTCPVCSTVYSKIQVNKNWKCPSCNEEIIIRGEHVSTGESLVFIRKIASELGKNDWVINYDGIHQVAGITILDGKKLGKIWIGLNKFGRIERDVNVYMSCLK